MKDSPAQMWFQEYLQFHCDDCGCDSGYRSRSRTFSERYLLPIFLLQPVRCSECFRRDYRLIFMPVKNRGAQARFSEALAPQDLSNPRIGKPVAAIGKGQSRNVA